MLSRSVWPPKMNSSAVLIPPLPSSFTITSFTNLLSISSPVDYLPSSPFSLFIPSKSSLKLVSVSVFLSVLRPFPMSYLFPVLLRQIPELLYCLAISMQKTESLHIEPDLGNKRDRCWFISTSLSSIQSLNNWILLRCQAKLSGEFKISCTLDFDHLYLHSNLFLVLEY